MPDFSQLVKDYIFDFALKEQSLVYVRINSAGAISTLGGDLSKYKLEYLEIGQQAEEQIIFLQGLLPLDGQTLVLHKIQIESDIVADLHLFFKDGAYWVLLIDSSLEMQHQKKWQQKYNELSLLQEKYDQLNNEFNYLNE
jgi:hypothetical protein